MPRVPLRPREAALLAYFKCHPRRTISRDELYRELWKFNYRKDSRVVDQTVATLRSKLLPPEGRIRTIHGFGYRFESG